MIAGDRGIPLEMAGVRMWSVYELSQLAMRPKMDVCQAAASLNIRMWTRIGSQLLQAMDGFPLNHDPLVRSALRSHAAAYLKGHEEPSTWVRTPASPAQKEERKAQALKEKEDFKRYHGSIAWAAIADEQPPVAGRNGERPGNALQMHSGVSDRFVHKFDAIVSDGTTQTISGDFGLIDVEAVEGRGVVMVHSLIEPCVREPDARRILESLGVAPDVLTAPPRILSALNRPDWDAVADALDPNHKNHAPHLALAMRAWIALHRNPAGKHRSQSQISVWLQKNATESTVSAARRIAAVVTPGHQRKKAAGKR